MDITGIIALVACAASICAKMFFLLQERRQARILERENKTCDAVRTELYLAKVKRKRLETARNKFTVKSQKLQQNITNQEIALQELQEQKQQEDEVRELQREIIKGKKNP